MSPAVHAMLVTLAQSKNWGRFWGKLEQQGHMGELLVVGKGRGLTAEPELHPALRPRPTGRGPTRWPRSPPEPPRLHTQDRDRGRPRSAAGRPTPKQEQGGSRQQEQGRSYLNLLLVHL